MAEYLESGGLRCACGQSGRIFACTGSYCENGVTYGVFTGYCSEECYEKDKASRHAAAVTEEQPTLPM